MPKRLVIPILALCLAATCTPLRAEETLPEPDSVTLIIFKSGQWFQVRTLEDMGGAVMYTEMGGTLVSAPKQMVNWTATQAANNALVEIEELCPEMNGPPVYLGAFENLEGRVKNYTWQLAQRSNEPAGKPDGDAEVGR